MTTLTPSQNAQAVISQLRGVGPQPVSEIQTCLGMTKREVEHALWVLCSRGEAEYTHPMTSPPTYKAVV